MKRLALVCLLATGVVGLHAETFIDNARVRSVEPQYENVSCPARGVREPAGSTKCAAPAAGRITAAP